MSQSCIYSLQHAQGYSRGSRRVNLLCMLGVDGRGHGGQAGLQGRAAGRIVRGRRAAAAGHVHPRCPALWRQCCCRRRSRCTGWYTGTNTAPAVVSFNADHPARLCCLHPAQAHGQQAIKVKDCRKTTRRISVDAPAQQGQSRGHTDSWEMRSVSLSVMHTDS